MYYDIQGAGMGDAGITGKLDIKQYGQWLGITGTTSDGSPYALVIQGFDGKLMVNQAMRSGNLTTLPLFTEPVSITITSNNIPLDNKIWQPGVDDVTIPKPSTVVPGTATPAVVATSGFSLGDFISQNPGLALGGAAAIVVGFFFMEHK